MRADRNKSRFHNVTSLNLLSWGSKKWIYDTTVINKTEVFYHKYVCRMLKTSTTEVKEERIKNEVIWKTFLNEESVVDT